MDGKILIIDDLATNRIVYKVRLGAAFYQPIVAADGESGLRLARTAQPDAILLDLMLPDIPGVEVLRRLRRDPATRDIPVVVLTSSGHPGDRLAALQAGADEVMAKPVDEQVLLARLRNLLRGRDGEGFAAGQARMRMDVQGLAEPAAAMDRPATLALVADRADTAMRWRRDLQPQLFDRLVILTREDVLTDGGALPDGAIPDVFVIDADLGGMAGGLRLMSDLRSRGTTRHAAICMVAGRDASDLAAMAFDLGANDIVPADVGPTELALRLRGLLRRKRQGDRSRASVQTGLRMAMLDPLTGLYNRRFALPHLSAIAEDAMATGRPFAVMVVDLDRFKSVNDRFGHAAGDAVLVEVARRLSANLRVSDLLARIGGEEFLIALPATQRDEAQLMGQRLCQAVEEMPMRLGNGQSLAVTVSIGVEVALPRPPELATRPTGDYVADVVNRADRALMESKAAGRNQVRFSHAAA